MDTAQPRLDPTTRRSLKSSAYSFALPKDCDDHRVDLFPSRQVFPWAPGVAP